MTPRSNRLRAKRVALLAATAAALVVAPTASAQTITEFSAGLSVNAAPEGITAGPDGNVWFTESAANKIGRITPSGTITEFSGLTGRAPQDITAGPDGNLWFTEIDGYNVGQITPAGTITEFAVSATYPYLIGITAGPDGNLWYALRDRGIGQMTPTGTPQEFPAGAGATPNQITAGPDGNLWFTHVFSDRISRMTTTGDVTNFSAGITANSSPEGITTGPDGALWFAEDIGSINQTGRIGRITTSGVVTEFSSGISANGQPQDITLGPDGNLWFTEHTAQGGSPKIGRIDFGAGGGGGGGSGGGPYDEPPSNDFQVHKDIVICSSKETYHCIRITIVVPGPGKLSATDAHPRPVLRGPAAKKYKPLIKPAKATAAAAGDVSLKLKTTAAGEKKLKRKGKLKVSVRITFTPTGGTPASQKTKVTLKDKHH